MSVKPSEGKPPVSLIPREAIIEEAKAFAYGSGKHGRYAFREGVEYTKLIDATLRHVLALADGEDIDVESQCNHAANARANLGMLLYMMANKPEMDDRHTKPPTPKPLSQETLSAKYKQKMAQEELERDVQEINAFRFSQETSAPKYLSEEQVQDLVQCQKELNNWGRDRTTGVTVKRPKMGLSKDMVFEGSKK